jgi:hypothetical protein
MMGGIYEVAVKMGSVVVIKTPNFKVDRGRYTDNRQTVTETHTAGDRISLLLFFFKIRKVG